MKQWYNTFRFFFACAVIFGGGYLFAKPRNDADKLFAPIIAAIGVSSLWRARKSKYPEPSQQSDFRRKSNLNLVLEWGLLILVAIVMWASVRFGVR
jgi:amino acid permease